MWRTDAERLALLELMMLRRLKRRAANAAAFDHLVSLSWTRRASRRDEIALAEGRLADLTTLLDRVWPGWAEARAELDAHALPPTLDGWNQLLDLRRAAQMPALPERINRHTAATLAAPHSKSSLTRTRRAALGDTHATHDGLIRIRPPMGLTARTADGQIDLGEVGRVLGEVALPERAFLDGLALEGPLRATITIENLGAWRDLPPVAGCLLVHVPGWNTTTTLSHLLARVAHAPLVQFGDLDAAGVRIIRHLRESRPDVRWLVPPFWAEYVDAYGLPCDWPPDLASAEVPPLVRELMRRGLWLEQERVVVDPRIVGAIEAMLG